MAFNLSGRLLRHLHPVAICTIFRCASDMFQAWLLIYHLYLMVIMQLVTTGQVYKSVYVGVRI